MLGVRPTGYRAPLWQMSFETPAILARHPSARFVLLGADAGGEGARLRELARRLGVEAALELTPWAGDPR